VGVIAQRLVRRLCEHCKEPVKKTEARLERLGITEDREVFRGRGCKHCRMTGYSGRLGIFEFLTVDASLKRMIAVAAKEDEILAYARQNGVKSLRNKGIERVLAGETTIEEILRVTEEE